jgi:hypothetical protein
MLNNGFYPQRGGDVQIILKPGYIEGYSKLVQPTGFGILMMHTFLCFGMAGV